MPLRPPGALGAPSGLQGPLAATIKAPLLRAGGDSSLKGSTIVAMASVGGACARKRIQGTHLGTLGIPWNIWRGPWHCGAFFDFSRLSVRLSCRVPCPGVLRCLVQVLLSRRLHGLLKLSNLVLSDSVKGVSMPFEVIGPVHKLRCPGHGLILSWTGPFLSNQTLTASSSLSSVPEAF